MKYGERMHNQGRRRSKIYTPFSPTASNATRDHRLSLDRILLNYKADTTSRGAAPSGHTLAQALYKDGTPKYTMLVHPPVCQLAAEATVWLGAYGSAGGCGCGLPGLLLGDRREEAFRFRLCRGAVTHARTSPRKGRSQGSHTRLSRPFIGSPPTFKQRRAPPLVFVGLPVAALAIAHIHVVVLPHTLGSTSTGVSGLWSARSGRVSTACLPAAHPCCSRLGRRLGSCQSRTRRQHDQHRGEHHRSVP